MSSSASDRRGTAQVRGPREMAVWLDELAPRFVVRQTGAEFGRSHGTWYVQDRELGYCSDPTTRARALRRARILNHQHGG